MLTDKCGQPKGFAYVEVPEAEAIQEALALNESELHGRPLKVILYLLSAPCLLLLCESIETTGEVRSTSTPVTS